MVQRFNSTFRNWFYLLFLILSTSNAWSQIIELVGNGNFEGFSELPDNISQTAKLNSNWFGVSGATPDFYHKNGIQGPCNLSVSTANQLNANNFLTITQSIIPKIEPFDLGYCGFGTSEIIGTELLNTVTQNNLVKFSFDYSFRDNFQPLTLSFRFGLDNDLPEANVDFSTTTLGIITITKNNTTQFQSCNWFHYESDWIKINEGNWKVLTLGGINNIAGAIDAIGYLYIDNVSLLASSSCCQENQFYQNSTALPETTKVINQIQLGENVISGKPIGPVIISSGETAVMQAKEIILKKGVIREVGGTLILEPIPCSPYNNQASGNIITPIILPNFLLKDNFNTLNFEFQNVEYYKLKIYNRYGCLVFENDWQKVEANIFGSWNGGCEGNCSVLNNDGCSDGTYYYILKVKNCTSQSEYQNYLEVLSPSNARVTINSTNSESINENPESFTDPNNLSLEEFDKIIVYPVPSKGQINICVPLVLLETELSFDLFNSQGEKIINEIKIKSSKTVINLEGLSGLYLLKINSDNQQTTKRLILSY
jgi:hypothetical protein